MKHSESIAALAPALVKASAELKAVQRDRENSHFRNRYATLDAIIESVRPTLAKHGLAVVQGATAPLSREDGLVAGFIVETMLVHSSGEWIVSSAVMPLVKADPQSAGSALTYGRRYGLSALLSLATDDDDDAESAQPPRNAAPPRQSAPPRAERPAAAPAPAPQASGRQAANKGDECPKCSGPMWDNRVGKKNPKSPDYKCKDKACDGVIWPSRDVAPAPQMDESEWERIDEDMASDEMPF
jgi:hypothetical protein